MTISKIIIIIIFAKNVTIIMISEEVSTERPIFGLPLGIYTNHFGKGCQRNNRGVYRWRWRWRWPRDTFPPGQIPTALNLSAMIMVGICQRQNPTNDDEEEVLFLVWTVLELELNHFCHLVLTCNNNLVSWVKIAAWSDTFSYSILVLLIHAECVSLHSN